MDKWVCNGRGEEGGWYNTEQRMSIFWCGLRGEKNGEGKECG